MRGEFQSVEKSLLEGVGVHFSIILRNGVLEEFPVTEDFIMLESEWDLLRVVKGI